jgi:hypothetical protein
MCNPEMGIAYVYKGVLSYMDLCQDAGGAMQEHMHCSMLRKTPVTCRRVVRATRQAGTAAHAGKHGMHQGSTAHEAALCFNTNSVSVSATNEAHPAQLMQVLPWRERLTCMCQVGGCTCCVFAQPNTCCSQSCCTKNCRTRHGQKTAAAAERQEINSCGATVDML